MIRINLLRVRTVARRRKKIVIRLPFKKIGVGVVCVALAGAAGWGVRYVKSHSGGVIITQKRTVEIKENTTPFDVVDDIVDDIHGGRFNVRLLNRLSSPAHLSVNEKKVYERFFIKHTFDLFNAAIKPGMGFNTITLDNSGNFFVYGLTAQESAARDFQAELKKSDGILAADELDFKKKFFDAKTSFALKGFLNYNILEKLYDDDSWKQDEIFCENKETVWYDMTQLGKNWNIQVTRQAEWGGFDVYGAYKKHTLQFQVTAAYGDFMKWITALYERNLQIGYSKVNLTSIGGQKILIAVECYIYAKN